MPPAPAAPAASSVDEVAPTMDGSSPSAAGCGTAVAIMAMMPMFGFGARLFGLPPPSAKGFPSILFWKPSPLGFRAMALIPIPVSETSEH